MRKLIFLFFLFPFIGFSQLNWEIDNTNGSAFIENQGQFDDRNWQKNKIEYGVESGSFHVFFTKTGLTYRFDKMIRNGDEHEKEKKKNESEWMNKSELVHITWLNANPNVEIISENPVSGYFSFAIKNPKTKEVYNVNHIQGYQKLIYKNLYDNIDLVYEIFPKQGIKYSLLIHPGADVSKVKMKYASGHTNRNDEFVRYYLDDLGNIQIKTSLGHIIERDLKTFYQNGIPIASSYNFKNDILSFNLATYDNTQEVVIDPWVVNETANSGNSSSAVWEVETDDNGNVYTISNEMGMQLKKYNSTGAWVWTYNTPWDTASVWIGTLATDGSGTSYVTSGTTPEIERIDASGSMVWQASGYNASCEYWSITFNCDKTKLIVGGTYVPGILSFDFYSAIYDIDITNGNVVNYQTFNMVNIGGFSIPPITPIEVRGICAAKNAKYFYVTHDDVGLINQNFGQCPNPQPVFQTDNGHHYAYKCENYLPATQNGGGLKAITANDNYFYVHTGDHVEQRSYVDGSIINSVAIPSGQATTSLGEVVVKDCGLDVDDNGNVYVGSDGLVAKYDQNLNLLSQAAVGMTVYDVSVNNNGEVVAVGAVSNNGNSTDRQGKVQSVNLSAGAQYVASCCDANICPPQPLCSNDPATTLTASTSGGTWSGTGITNATTGVFDPSVAGVGTHWVYYTLSCGMDSVQIEVIDCTPITVCDDGTNLVASGGSGTISWNEQQTQSTSIVTEQDCIDCPSATPEYMLGFYTGCDISTCNQTIWVEYTTGTTVSPPATWPLMVTNGIDTVIFNSQAEISPCGACTPPTLSVSGTDVTCAGGSDGAADLTVTPGSGSSYTYSWTGPSGFTATTEDLSGLSAGTYNVTVTDASNSSCTATATITINDGALTEDASFTLTDFCEGAANSATGIATPGGTFSFNPVPSNGETINSSTGEITGGIGGNTYTVQYTTNGACPGTSTQTVNVTVLTYTATTTPEACGAGDGEIVLTPTSGTGPYTYSIDGGTTTQGTGTFSGLTTGNYNIVITDGSGCSVTGTENVGSQGGPTIDNMTNTNPSCLGVCDGEISVTVSGGTPPYSYQWYDAGNNPIGTNAGTITGLCAGDYSVEITDAAGGGSTVLNSNSDFEAGSGGGCDCATGYNCSNDAGQVFDGNHPVYTSGNQGCITGTTNYTSSLGAHSGTGYIYFYAGADAISTGPFTFVGGETVEICVYYSGPQGSGPAGQNTSNSYFTFGIDGVSVSPHVLVPTNTGWTQYCFTVIMTAGNHTFDILSGGAAQYSIWFDDFTVSIQNGIGCPTTQATTLVDPAPVDASFTFVDFCEGASNGPSNIATIGGTFAFNPVPGGGETINPSTGVISNEIGGNTYTIEYTIGGVCPATSTQTVTVNPNPTPMIAGSTTFCTGSSTTLDAGSYSSYNWSTGVSTQTYVVNTAGTYSVTVTDNNGCTGSDQVTVTEAASLSPIISGNTAFCAGASTTLDVGSGFATYAWNTGATSQTINVTAAGTFSVTVTDASGCSGDTQIVVTENPLPTPTITGSLTFCTGSSTVLDAGSGYSTYSWNTGGTGQTIVVTSAGTYSVTVTDAVGCTGSDQVIVSESATITPTITGVLSICTGNSTTLDAGTGYNSYTWSTGETTQTILVSTAGTYSVTVTDAGGCTGSDQVTVTEFPGLSPVITGNTSICAGSSTTLNVGSGYSSYLWSTGASTASITVFSSGTYSVTVTDANGCSGSTQVTVQSSPPIFFNVFTNDADVCPGESVEINGVITGGLQPYTLMDETGNVINFPYIVYPTDTTTYTLTVHDACGGSQTGSIDVIVYSVPAPTFTSNIIDGCQPLTVLFNETHDYASYIWSFGDNSYDNLSFEHNPQHTFQNSGVFDVSVTATNEYGCSGSFSFPDMITVYPKPDAKFSADPSIASIIHPLVNFYNYSILNDFNFWSFGDGDSSLLVDPYHLYPDTGIYIVTLIVETQNGCKDTTMSSILIRPEITFYAPTAFSPDGDNQNDVFFVTGTGIDTVNFNLYVYDRWGEVIFESDDIMKVWDGTTADGKVAENGIYIWLCYYYDIFAIAHQETGQVMIIR
ncbi:MAG: gliding motility-associated C-terminal domain-containing protein [Bacteroidales bacterium]|nr:gliding motility-associated C-terminal domain-containing protein [Bacteroidales bacterium]